ncbi:protein FAR1-RELATED SEQUENCE 5-like [Silene latifolia]|uniref:protein FAR1-RELATED SEQUENCE 5-like n=1 Tax=Silene latifolia TaxID=37657 RepID=UPI003D77725A
MEEDDEGKIGPNDKWSCEINLLEEPIFEKFEVCLEEEEECLHENLLKPTMELMILGDDIMDLLTKVKSSYKNYLVEKLKERAKKEPTCGKLAPTIPTPKTPHHKCHGSSPSILGRSPSPNLVKQNGVQPDMQESCREVEKRFTPYIGQSLGVEDAVPFYKIYAIACGFDVRRYTTKKWRGGEIKSKLVVCNREGFPHKTPRKDQDGGLDGEKSQRIFRVTRVGCKARIRLYIKNGLLLIDRFHEGHNHELISLKDREFQKLSRNITDYHKMIIVSNSRLNIGATKTYRIGKEQVNGYENIGASLNDFKNFHRDVKCFIHERDDQLFVDHFKEMTETRIGFYFDYDLDDDGSLRRAIWADDTARDNYKIFGDAVSFDPTYSTNKYSMVFTPFIGVDHHKRSVTFCGALFAREDYESFNWVFSRFLQAMGGMEPEYIITDQDPGIIKSVPLVFKTARHRFCM